jgi:hypothetical protein
MAVFGRDFYGLTKYGANVLAEFDVNPFDANPDGYGAIRVTWHSPSGAWDRIRLIRSRTGYAVNETDGEILVDTDGTTNSYVDQGLVGGSFYYYALFVHADDAWNRAGATSSLVVKKPWVRRETDILDLRFEQQEVPYGHAELMWERIPAYFRYVRRKNTAVTDEYVFAPNSEAFLIDPESYDQENQHLRQFLNVLGWGLDYVHNYQETLLRANDPRQAHLKDVNRLADEMGIDFEYGVPASVMRSKVANAALLARRRGTLDGLRDVVTLTTGWDVDLQPNQNLFLNRDQSEFANPLYPEWDSGTNYAIGQKVQFEARIFTAVAGAYGTAQKPPSSPTNSNTWWTVTTDQDVTTLRRADTQGVVTWKGFANGVNPRALGLAVGVSDPISGVGQESNALVVRNTGTDTPSSVRTNLQSHPIADGTGSYGSSTGGWGTSPTGSNPTTGGPVSGNYRRFTAVAAFTPAALAVIMLQQLTLGIPGVTAQASCAAVPGQTYTLSLYVRSSIAQTVSLFGVWLDATGASSGTAATGSDVTLVANTWTRLSVTGVAPAGTAVLRVDVRAGGATRLAWAIGNTFDVGDCMIEQSGSLGGYFNGNTTDTPSLAYAWTGATNASTSTLSNLDVTYDVVGASNLVGVTDVLPKAAQAIRQGVPIPRPSVWNPEREYALNVVVQHRGASWRSIGTSLNQEPVTGSVYWEKVGVDDRPLLAYSFYAHGPLTGTAGSGGVAVTPGLAFFDEQGKTLVDQTNLTALTNFVFDTFNHNFGTPDYGTWGDWSTTGTWDTEPIDDDDDPVAYPVGSTGVALQTVPGTLIQYRVAATFAKPALSGHTDALAIRYVDASNYMAVTRTDVRKKVTGTTTVLNTLATPIKDGDRVTMVINDTANTYTLLVNGVSAATGTLSGGSSPYKHGMMVF